MTSDVKLTEPQQRCLRVLAEVSAERSYTPYATPRQIAQRLWPDSPAWNQRTHRKGWTGSGALGGTMPMKAAALLWRLHRHGLADLATHDTNHWVLTAAGRALLVEGEPLPGL